MRKIIHIDMDCFFAAVEMRDNPLLANQPLAVGGSSERRGVISTCNYYARQFGVRSAMATAKAKLLCPQLVLVPGRMDVYKEVSQQIRAIFAQYSPLVEPLSLDEAYIDVSQSTECQGSATLIAQQIRQQIYHKTGLTASAGIAPNKFMAKIASDLNKPNGQYVVTPAEVDSFALALPLNKIPGVGKVTFEKLKKFGFNTGADVRAVDELVMLKHFGKFGLDIRQRCLGIDNRLVNPSRVRKSVGVETTLPADITTEKECIAILDQLYPELIRRLKKVPSLKGIKKQGIKIKFNDFQSTTVEKSSLEINYQLWLQLLTQALTRAKGRKIRLIGLNIGLAVVEKENVTNSSSSLAVSQQLNLF